MQMIWEVPLIGQARREKISERMKILQDLVPGCNKVQYGFFYVFYGFFLFVGLSNWLCDEFSLFIQICYTKLEKNYVLRFAQLI